MAPSPASLADATAVELRRLYRSDQASPVDATRAVLARIAQHNPKLNAYMLVDEDRVLASARASEVRWQAHRRDRTPVGELDGVPVSIKDLVLTRAAGRRGAAAAPSTRASRGRSTRLPRRGCAKPARCCSARPRRPSSAARARPIRPRAATPAIPGIRPRRRAARRGIG